MKMLATIFGLVLTISFLSGCASSGCKKCQPCIPVASAAVVSEAVEETVLEAPTQSKVPVYVKK